MTQPVVSQVTTSPKVAVTKTKQQLQIEKAFAAEGKAVSDLIIEATEGKGVVNVYGIYKRQAFFQLLDEDKKFLADSTNENHKDKKDACFYYLPAKIKANSTTAYLRYQLDPAGQSFTTRQEKINWLSLLKALELLPPTDSSIEQLIDQGIYIDLRPNNVTAGQLYLWLCLFRFLVEAPGVIKYVPRLVNEAGCDFWAALCYCHNLHGNFLDQTIIPYCKGYTVNTSHSKLKYKTLGFKSNPSDLAIPLHLHLICHKLAEYDSRHYLTRCKIDGRCFWSWLEKTVIPPKAFLLKSSELILSKAALPVVLAESWEEAEKQFEQLKLKEGYVY